MAVVATKVIRVDVIASAAAQANIKALGNSIKGVDDSVKKLKGSMDSGFGGISRTFGNLRNILVGLGIGGGFIALGRAAITASEDYRVLGSRLEVVLRSQAATVIATKEIVRISNESGRSIDGVARLYEKAARAGQQFGISQRDVTKITEGFSQSLRVSGTSTQEAQAALIQFGQALASGRLQGDEFRSLTENNSFFMNEFAKALGVTISELRAMGTAGKLNSELLFGTMLKVGADGLTLLERINKEAAKIPLTFSQAMQAIKNSATVALGELSKFTLGAEGLGTAFKPLTDALTRGTEAFRKMREEADAMGDGWVVRIGKLLEFFSRSDPTRDLVVGEKGLPDRVAKQTAELLKLNKQVQTYYETNRKVIEDVHNQSAAAGVVRQIYIDQKTEVDKLATSVSKLKAIEASRDQGIAQSDMKFETPRPLSDFEKVLKSLNGELAEAKIGAEKTKSAYQKLIETIATGKLDIKSKGEIEKLKALAREIDRVEDSSKKKKGTKGETPFQREFERLTEDLLNLRSGADETKSAFQKLVDALASGKLEVKSEKERDKLKALAKEFDNVKAAKERDEYLDKVRLSLSSEKAKALVEEAAARAKIVDAIDDSNDKLREEIDLLNSGKNSQEENAISKLNNAIAAKELELSIRKLSGTDSGYLDTLKKETAIFKERAASAVGGKTAPDIDNSKLRENIELLSAEKRVQDELAVSKLRSSIASRELAIANIQLTGDGVEFLDILRKEVVALKERASAIGGVKRIEPIAVDRGGIELLGAEKRAQDELTTSKLKGATASRDIAAASKPTKGVLEFVDALHREATALKERNAAVNSGTKAVPMAVSSGNVEVLNTEKLAHDNLAVSKLKSAIASRELAIANVQLTGDGIEFLDMLNREVVALKERASAISGGKVSAVVDNSGLREGIDLLNAGKSAQDGLAASTLKSVSATNELAVATRQLTVEETEYNASLEREIRASKEQRALLAKKEAATIVGDNDKLREEIETIRAGKKGLDELEISKIRNTIASKELTIAAAQLNGADAEYVKTLQQQIDLLKERIGLVSERNVVRDDEEKRKKLEDDERDRIKQLNSSFVENFRQSKDIGRAITDTIREALAARIFEVVVNPLIEPFIKDMERAITYIADALRDALTNAIQSAQTEKTFAGFFSRLFGGAGGAGGDGGYGGDYEASAKGRAFRDGAEVEKYAGGGIFGPNGGLMRKPTMFRAGGAWGMGGEAGTEAVMPLGRNARGELGVLSAGTKQGNAQPLINMPVTVENNTGTPVQASAERDPMSGGMRLILTKAVRDVVNGDLNRGDGITGSLSKRFSLNPAQGSPISGR